jgi:hypothetical protein
MRHRTKYIVGTATLVVIAGAASIGISAAASGDGPNDTDGPDDDGAISGPRIG